MKFGGIQPTWWMTVHAFEFEISVALSVLIAFYLLYHVYWRSNSGNFPPGPTGLYVVGYFPFLRNEYFREFIKLGKKYGDVFSLQLGPERVVVLHGPEAIREAFSKSEFLGRPPHRSVTTLQIDNLGSAFFSEDMRRWHEQRKFVVHTLKDLGLGRTKIEGQVQDEIGYFLDTLSGQEGVPLDIRDTLFSSTSNNISALLFGKRQDQDDPDRLILFKNLFEASEFVSETGMFFNFSWFRDFPFLVKLFHVNKSGRAIANLMKYFRQVIEQHKRMLNPENVRDFIDKFLLEMRVRQEKDPSTTFTELTLLSNVADIFFAGSETTSSFILWGVYIVAAFPDVQRRIRDEIRKVIGQERKPEFLDMKSMPYTHAVMLEVMRWKTILPLNLLRYTVEDTTVGGYDIPRHTMVIANFWNAHHDTRYWEKPDSFKPERFLSKDGNSVVKSPNFMPFSLGKRVCPGESMAYMEIFLYFTSMLQRFEIAFPEGTVPDFKAKTGLTYQKKPCTVRFIQRS